MLDYEKQKKRSRDKQAELSRAGRDIGPPPAPADFARRNAAQSSLLAFCNSYFSTRFFLRWSPDHLQVIARMESAILHGGLFAIAMPRGSGKTSLAEVAALWSLMIGRHKFVVLVAVSAARAQQLLESIKTELLSNEPLAEDWPEILHPIRALENRANRAKGQHIADVPTHVSWKLNEIVLPHVIGSQAGCGVLRVAGLTSGSIRGPKFTRPSDGQTVRPSLVIIDDPQDDESAASPSQCEKRHHLLHAAIGGMAGPREKITAICPCTVIFPGDLAARLLDKQASPLWTGQRYQLLARMPERMDLWDEYGIRRADEFRNGGDGKLATAWYGQQKELMDRGAIASWPERHNCDELSAVQYAMNLYYLNKTAFMSEYQNDPLPLRVGSDDQLTVKQLAGRINNLGCGVVPLWATKLTCYIDVQAACLYWLVAAWSEKFTGAVIDYGTWPDQGRKYFTLDSVKRTLALATPGAGLEGSIQSGLTRLHSELSREWRREDGTSLRIDRFLVDANWGASTDTVYDWCRGSGATPCHGRYVGASSRPWSEYTHRPGETLGLHWLLSTAVKRVVRHLLIDANFWKSFLATRLSTAVGDQGAVTFFGGADHQLLIDHLCSEYRIQTEGRGRVVDEWRARPGRPDNHWLDCLAGCAVAASVLGCDLSAQNSTKEKSISFKEMQAAARARQRPRAGLPLGPCGGSGGLQ